MQKETREQKENRNPTAEEGRQRLVWMRLAEAAERLGCDPATVRRRYRNPNYPYRYQRRRTPNGGVEYGIPQEELESLDRYQRPEELQEESRSSTAWNDPADEQGRLRERREASLHGENELLRQLLDERKKLHQREVGRLEGQIQELREELQERRERIATLERRIEEVEERLQSALRESAEGSRELAHRIAALVGEVERSRVRILELAPLESEVPRLQAQIEEKEASLRRAQERLEELDRLSSGRVVGPIFRLLRRRASRR